MSVLAIYDMAIYLKLGREIMPPSAGLESRANFAHRWRSFVATCGRVDRWPPS